MSEQPSQNAEPTGRDIETASGNGQQHGGRRGRPFAKGNPGRPRGSKNRASLVAQALLEGEGDELVRKAIDLAKSGDGPMLKFLVERLLPKERVIEVDFPTMDYADDAIDAQAAIIKAVVEGRITLSEAAALSKMVGDYSRSIEVAELTRRFDDLERQLKSQHRWM